MTTLAWNDDRTIVTDQNGDLVTQEAIPPVHTNIASALAAAQLQMSGAKKKSENAHLKTKYSDLRSVMDACMRALNTNGIAVIQPMAQDGHDEYVETIFIHGHSGETLKGRARIIVQKNDMQGYGSAITYARRYGLMAMAGIASEDDDGEAAVKAAPQESPQNRELDWFQKTLPSVNDAEGINKLLGRAKKAGRNASALLVARAKDLQLEFDAETRSYVYLEETLPNADLDFDEIPFSEV